MDKLRQHVARARWRLTLGRFAAALAWCWSVALAIAVIAVAAIKIWPVPVDSWIWTAAWIGGTLLMGLIVALSWAWLRRDDFLDAAIELDRRFALKQRVSSTLAMRPEELESPAGQALLSDALRRVERIDVGSQFKVPLGRRNLIPLAPALALVGLTFIADKLPASQAAASTGPTVTQHLPQAVDVLRRRMAERKKEATEQGLKDAGDLFKKIEEGIKDLSAKDSSDHKQALVKLNDLAKQLEQRREKLGGDDKLKQQLNQMKDLKDGPADKLTAALKKGDFQKALKELDKLQNDLKSDKLEPAQQQKMAEQLDAMRQNLEKLADKHSQMKKDLERQIKQMADAGKSSDAQKLKNQLDKLQQQSPQMDQLKQLASQCKQCAQAMKDGKPGAADKAISQLSDKLSQLKKQSDEAQMLDAAADEICDAKSEMAGGNCPPDEMSKDGKSGQSTSDKDMDGPPGSGLGKGKGKGSRPESPTATKFYDSNVKQKLGKGAAVATGPADGPNIKGQVQAEIKAQIESAAHDAADPLTGQRLPRSQREHAKEYFDALREGK